MQCKNLGNAFHTVSSVSVAAYTLAAILFARPGSTVFDSEWVQHGFCVVQKDVPYWNTHDLCLYLDIFLVAIGLLVYQSFRGMPDPEMKTADDMMLFNLLGHLGHGIAHGFIARKYRGGGDFTGAQHISAIEMYLQEGMTDPKEIATIAVVAMGFWFGLLKGIAPTLKKGQLAIVCVLVNTGGLFVRDVLGFSYVQAVLAVVFTWTQLALPEHAKGFFYAANAVVSFVLSLVPWVESMACQRVAANFGGHLIYDAAIPVLLLASYCTSWYHYSAKGKMKKVV